ncbi:MAG: hypothetical protein EKK42_13850 [Pseudonocardiaceae bacterium]|nr:MAG: hypothetical protein EKK42_13850 [Pseudonocardiaceae bacterium]
MTGPPEWCRGGWCRGRTGRRPWCRRPGSRCRRRRRGRCRGWCRSPGSSRRRRFRSSRCRSSRGVPSGLGHGGSHSRVRRNCGMGARNGADETRGGYPAGRETVRRPGAGGRRRAGPRRR